MSPRRFRKAIVGALVAGGGVLAGAVGDGISAQEWITTVVAALGGFEAVYWTRNARKQEGRA